MDLLAKEENVLAKSFVQCFLILLAARYLTIFYSIKFLPYSCSLQDHLFAQAEESNPPQHW